MSLLTLDLWSSINEGYLPVINSATTTHEPRSRSKRAGRRCSGLSRYSSCVVFVWMVMCWFRTRILQADPKFVFGLFYCIWVPG
ncbi:hypothetical protein FIBSPDRAFT_847179 [Athelia psychrophila]|uniref:Uncharacterized protein n=1 Tax=Athelia psychrophila TaxID=1759441 RepID=A0A166WRT5_9AGAM|nr:hypothetical protein FIBSPDRAFT_869217 [Fibularhizoctonia sp. CBS 109695]KZP34040.1 hypothetical protein FIBSPDRAFT_847179 [Fibularhizoctonia sp. CBS 109695]